MTCRVGIDATELAGPPGGVRRGLSLLFSALRDHGQDLEVVALSPRPVPVPAGVANRVTGGPRRPLFWRRSRALARALMDLDHFHSPVTALPRAPGRCSATVHELSFVAQPRRASPSRMVAEWFALSRAMGAARTLVVPSKATLDQVAAVHPAATRIARVIPHCAPPVPEGKPGEDGGSLLYVGRLDRRKRVPLLLRALAGLPGELKLVGPQAPRALRRLRELAAELGVARRVDFAGAVSEEALDALYRTARAVVVPAVSEGFGFPVLEALSRGTPVFVAAGTGAAETGGDAAVVVEGGSVEAWTTALRRAPDPALRRRARERGPARAAEFAPRATALAYREVFVDAASR